MNRASKMEALFHEKNVIYKQNGLSGRRFIKRNKLQIVLSMNGLLRKIQLIHI